MWVNLRNITLSEKTCHKRIYRNVNLLELKNTKLKQHCLGIHTNVVIYEIKQGNDLKNKMFQVADGRGCSDKEFSSSSRTGNLNKLVIYSLT